MPQLRMSGLCKNGQHGLCSGGEGTPGRFGGWKCTCGCHSKHLKEFFTTRPEEEIPKFILKDVKKKFTSK